MDRGTALPECESPIREGTGAISAVFSETWRIARSLTKGTMLTNVFQSSLARRDTSFLLRLWDHSSIHSIPFISIPFHSIPFVHSIPFDRGSPAGTMPVGFQRPG